ncbi:putative Magnetosome protein MamD [Gammaproteobacteria bacterium]
MAAETVMLKLSGAAQAAQVPMLSGQSFVVGKTVATGDGLGKWLFLHPLAGTGTAGEGMVALKLEGARQTGLLTSMVGKTVTVGQSPVGTVAAQNWLVLHPYMGGAVGKGAAGAALAAKGGGLQQVALRATEAAEIEGGKGAAAGAMKGVTGKGAMAGTCPLAGTAGKGAATGTLVNGTAVTGKTAVTGQTLLVGGTKTASSVKGVATGGTIWTGSGTKLGLGLGLGSLGPLLLVGVAAAVGVGIYSYMQRPAAEDEIDEAVS